MKNVQNVNSLRIVRVPQLDRVGLEELARLWSVTTEEAISRMIRKAVMHELAKMENVCTDT
jgi:hypothetical protein